MNFTTKFAWSFFFNFQIHQFHYFDFQNYIRLIFRQQLAIKITRPINNNIIYFFTGL